MDESFDHLVLSLSSFFSDTPSEFSYHEATLPISWGIFITFSIYWIFSFYFKIKQLRGRKPSLKELLIEKVWVQFLVIISIFSVIYYTDLDEILILSVLLVLIFWDHQNYFKEPQKRVLSLILFFIILSGLYTAISPVKGKTYLQPDRDCPKRHWILSFRDAQYFKLPRERVESISFIDLRLIPYNLSSLLESQTIQKNLNARELMFLSSEQEYASAKLKQMKKKKCIGIYIRGNEDPLKETPPFSRARTFYDVLKETALLLRE